MVLGDSQTWGWGLAVEDRYTNVAESYLDGAFPERDFEVLNFAWPGLPMVVERNILRDFKDLVNPDLIVVGFFVNDPQPRVQQVRYEEPYEQLRGSILQITEWVTSLGLPRVGTKIQVAIDNLVVKVGLVPPPEDDLGWTYGQNTTEWAQFKQALQDIKIMSDELNLPPPIIAFIENFIPPSGYTHLWQQVEKVASENGFTTYDHENEIFEWVAQGKIQPNEIHIKIDAHSSAKMNLIFAQKLRDVIVSYIENKNLCESASLEEGTTLAETPLSAKRLMSVQLGMNIRFLGYKVSGSDFTDEETVRLTYKRNHGWIETSPSEFIDLKKGQSFKLAFGWQILKKVKNNYAIFVHLVSRDGQRWILEDTIPCQGQCPTIYWQQPGVIIAPPDFPPILSDITPGERRSKQRVMWQYWIEPVTSFVDQHNITIDPKISPGKYKMVIGMYDITMGERIPAYDEIYETWLPKAQIILGKVTIR